MVKKILGRYRSYLYPAVLLLVFFVTIFWLATGRVNLLHTSYFRKLYLIVWPLAGNAKITQDFQAKYPGLSQVDVYFRHLNNRDQGEVVFHLKEACDAPADLAQVMVPVLAIHDGQFYPFKFPPIDDSAGRKFCVMLEARALEDQAQLGVYTSPTDVYGDGAAYYQRDTTTSRERGIVENKAQIGPEVTFSKTYTIWLPLIQTHETSFVEADADIGFQLYYNGPILSTVPVLLARLSENKPYLFGRPSFYAALFLLYFIVLGLLWNLIIKGKFDTKL